MVTYYCVKFFFINFATEASDFYNCLYKVNFVNKIGNIYLLL
jgi:hypothetical protein